MITKGLMVILLAAMMTGIGLRTDLGQVLATLRRPRLVASSLAANFLIVPLATALVVRLLGIDTMISAGLLIVAVCAGAPLGPAASMIARGDTPLAVGLMVLLAALSAVMAPALLGALLAPLAPHTNIKVDVVRIVATLLLIQVLPLTIGFATRRWAGPTAYRLAGPLLTISNVLLALAIVWIAAKQFDHFSQFDLRDFSAMGLLVALALGAGWLCGGPSVESRKTTALTTGIRNAAVSLVIATDNFPETPAVASVAACSFFTIVGGFGCAVCLARLGRLPRQIDAPATDHR